MEEGGTGTSGFYVCFEKAPERRGVFAEREGRKKLSDSERGVDCQGEQLV